MTYGDYGRWVDIQGVLFDDIYMTVKGAYPDVTEKQLRKWTIVTGGSQGHAYIREPRNYGT